MDNWFAEIIAFRQNTKNFFATKQITAVDFVLDTLQSLFQEDVSNIHKIHLLELLQESSSLLFPSPDSAEQAIGSLWNIFNQTGDSEAFIVLKGQILVTILSILITQEDVLSNTHLKALFVEIVDLLLLIISKVNSIETFHLRTVACHCLREVELNFPGILLRKIEPLYQLCQNEKLPCYQLYMGIFSLTLKNAILQLLTSTDGIAKNRITELLTERIEPLRPFNLSKEVIDKAQISNNNVAMKVLPKQVDVSQLRKVISFLIDSTNLMTSAQIIHVIVDLSDIMKVTPAVSSVIFKPLIIRYLPTMDLALFHMVFLLKLKFVSELFSDADNTSLLLRLLLSANHPSLPVGHRLLCLQWIQNCIEFKEISYDIAMDVRRSDRFFSVCHSTMFDGIDTQLFKLKLLSSSFHYGDSTDQQVSTVLMGCLINYRESLCFSMSSRVAVALFKALFLYYKDHSRNILLVQEIHLFLTNLIIKQPKLLNHVVDFINCVEEIQPNSTILTEFLKNITSHIVSLPLSEILPHLSDFLLLLEKSAEEPDISPEKILIFLSHLVNCPEVYENQNWLLGNNILAVCKNLLHHHNSAVIFKDLGDILFAIFTFFDDVDIRDRGRFYYTMLTCLSAEKLTLILQNTTFKESRSSPSMDQIVVGGGNFPSARFIQQLENPIFKLIRVPNKAIDNTLTFIEENEPADIPNDILTRYSQHLDSDEFEACAILTLSLHFVEVNTSDIDDTYSIMLQFKTSSNYKNSKEIGIPRLSKKVKENAGPCTKQLNVKIFPLEPTPAVFNISAIFSTQDGRIYACNLQALELKFSDLFLPLPVPPQWCPHQGLWRQLLFTKLWQTFRIAIKDRSDSNHLHQQSLCVLKLNTHHLSSIIQNNFSQYLVKPESQNEDVYQAGIFIPPTSHLLLKFVPKNLHVVVSILTDNWKIFPLVNDYLLELESSISSQLSQITDY